MITMKDNIQLLALIDSFITSFTGEAELDYNNKQQSECALALLEFIEGITEDGSFLDKHDITFNGKKLDGFVREQEANHMIDNGLSLRDQFAMAALSAIQYGTNAKCEMIASRAYKIADKMLEKRK